MAAKHLSLRRVFLAATSYETLMKSMMLVLLFILLTVASAPTLFPFHAAFKAAGGLASDRCSKILPCSATPFRPSLSTLKELPSPARNADMKFGNIAICRTRYVPK